MKKIILSLVITVSLILLYLLFLNSVSVGESVYRVFLKAGIEEIIKIANPFKVAWLIPVACYTIVECFVRGIGIAGAIVLLGLHSAFTYVSIKFNIMYGIIAHGLYNIMVINQVDSLYIFLFVFMSWLIVFVLINKPEENGYEF